MSVTALLYWTNPIVFLFYLLIYFDRVILFLSKPVERNNIEIKFQKLKMDLADTLVWDCDLLFLFPFCFLCHTSLWLVYPHRLWGDGEREREKDRHHASKTWRQFPECRGKWIELSMRFFSIFLYLCTQWNLYEGSWIFFFFVFKKKKISIGFSLFKVLQT